MTKRKLAAGLLVSACALALVGGGATAAIPCIPGVPLEACDPFSGTGPSGPDGEPAPPTAPPAPPAKPCDLHRSSGRSVFVGLVAEQIYSDTGNYRTCSLSHAALAGVRIIRQPLRWSQIEPRKGRYDFSYWDAYLTELARRNIRVLPILSEPPKFRSSAPARGAKRGFYPPRRYKAMGEFAADMVRRYGPNGRFWKTYPKVRKLPIRSWQVWNEPNLPFYWAPEPDAAAYTRLLATVSRAIKRVDPKAEVVNGGFPQSAIRGAVPQRRFLRGMYRAGAAKHFDTLAIHSYTNTHAELVAQIKGIRAEMRRARDGGRIWITEIGWASGGPDKRFTPGPAGQAKRIDRTFRFAVRNRRKLGIRGITYFMWQDARPVPGFGDYWGLHTGLLDIDGNQKPAYNAFTRHSLKLRNLR